MHCLKYIIRLISSHRLNFYRAMLSMRGSSHGPVSVCVCHKSPSRCSTETAKRRITQTAPHDSPGNLVFWRQRSPRNFTGATRMGTPNAGGVGQNRRLSTNNRLYLENDFKWHDWSPVAVKCDRLRRERMTDCGGVVTAALGLPSREELSSF